VLHPGNVDRKIMQVDKKARGKPDERELRVGDERGNRKHSVQGHAPPRKAIYYKGKENVDAQEGDDVHASTAHVGPIVNRESEKEWLYEQLWNRGENVCHEICRWYVQVILQLAIKNL